MSDSSFITNAAVDAINRNQATEQGQQAKKNKDIGKEEFLTMLVAQLKSQDPLDPMKNEDFAVNLAQFSQLEQLISINNKMGSETGDMASMAAYLGHQVVLGTDSVTVKNGSGGGISFDLGSSAEKVTLDLLDADGQVVETVELGKKDAGEQYVELKDLSAANGEYQVRVTARSANGAESRPEVFAAGVVGGFVPGPEPVLLVDGREVSPGDVREVRMAPQAA